MKQLFSYSILKACLLMAALLTTINAAAYDFEVNDIQYTITSDTTVEVTRYLPFSDDNLVNNYNNSIDGWFIEIPSHVVFNNVDYTVTTIGDWAFYSQYHPFFNPEGESGGYYIPLCFNITIPETINSIGFNALGGDEVDLINVFCLPKTPPIMIGSFSSPSDINLFVSTDAYPFYKDLSLEELGVTHIFITDGQRSSPPEFTFEEFYQPFEYKPYGFAVKLFRSENSIIYTREVHNYNGLYDHIYIDYWKRCDNLDSIYYYYEAECDGGSRADGCEFHFYVIEEGKSPSYYIECGGLNIPQKSNYSDIGFKSWTSFDFIDSDISYNIHNNEVEVTSQFYSGCSEDNHYGLIEYSGDVSIPKTATYHNYYNDTYTTYPVTTIGKGAFSLQALKENYYIEYDDIIDSLTSVTLPSSINLVEEYAFGDCPNLSFIKCKGAVPPSAYDNSFDDGVYQNTTLYVPRGAVEAYRNATGWKNFQNIVGHYDFDYDFVVDGVYYAIVGDDVVVTHGDNAYQGVVNIPAEVNYEGVTYDVAGISDGAFADATVQHLVLPVTIGTIGESAFAGCHIGSLVITGNGVWNAGAINCEVDNLYVMSGVTGIAGLQVNPAANVYSYSTVPPTCDSGSFTGYDAALHVPASALAAYFTAPYWNYFINITSDAVEPTGLTINNDNVAVLVGNQLMLTATPAPANATPGDIIWTSSDEAVATVQGGVITAVHVGECDINAYLLDKIAVCHVTVTEIAPTEISVNPEFAKLEIGSQLTLSATVLPEEATDKVVTWTTSNSAVATVDNMGTVTAVGQGECFITATCRDNQAMCHVIVVDHFVYITLGQHEVRLMPNHMVILTPSVTPEGTPIVVTSTNPDIAAARMANGKIQVVGIKEGTTIVKVNSTDGYAEADSCIVKVYTMRGDVNCDGFVNIGDVTSLINYLLSHNANGIDVVNADANNDGNVNISDVTRLINHILSGDELDPKDETEEDGLTFTVNGVTFTMVAVEGGTFTMGATAEQGDDALDAERPTHQVTLSGYAIGQTEVTQALWEAVTGNNPSRFAGRPDCPVEGVSWDECQAFITQLNALTGKQFRLPTEAEWEFAARGGNKSQHYKYAGSDDLDEVAWFHDNAYGIGDNGTRDVGTKKANELGIYDMSGNVWEWCQDIYDNYGSQPQTNPTGPESGTNRMRRGGAWDQGTVSCRVSHRSNRAPNYKYNNLGLRLAL